MTRIWNDVRPKSSATNWNGKDLDPSVGDIHPHNNHADNQKMVQGGGGSKRPSLYGPKHSAAAVKGSHWAKPDEGHDDDDSFKHTVGCMPNVHGHVKCFSDTVNLSGGVNQHEPFGATHTDSGRPTIHGFKQLYHIQQQRSGDTFQYMRHKARTKHE